MNTCKTCKWWDDKFEDRWDEATSKVVPREERLCLCPKIVSSKSDFDRWVDYEPSLAADEAKACDGSDFMAVLKTGPDFGCVHWEAKP